MALVMRGVVYVVRWQEGDEEFNSSFQDLGDGYRIIRRTTSIDEVDVTDEVT